MVSAFCTFTLIKLKSPAIQFIQNCDLLVVGWICSLSAIPLLSEITSGAIMEIPR